MTQLVVIVPLRDGMREHARLLLDQGPPFDVTTTTLTRHDVFLTSNEVVFVFEGPDPKRAVEELVGDVGVWTSAAGWKDCLGSRPRLAEHAFSWMRDTRARP